VDPLFRTAARVYGRRAVGVVLSGYLDDGTLGLMAVKRHGGVAVVQDPGDAACADMPAAAMSNVRVDHVATAAAMPELLARLAAGAPGAVEGENVMAADEARGGVEDVARGGGGPVGAGENSIDRKLREEGPPSALTCPECGGALWERTEGRVAHYTCHVGHGYTGEALEDQYVREVEAALWTAMRQLMETAKLHRRLAERMRESGQVERAGAYAERAAETERRAEVIRALLVNDRVGGLVGRAGAGEARAPAP
jgi:two-component system chemotaxis response regulator CheB